MMFSAELGSATKKEKKKAAKKEKSSHSDISSKSDDSSESEQTTSSDHKESSQTEPTNTNVSSNDNDITNVNDNVCRTRLQRRRLSNKDEKWNNGSENDKPGSESSNSGEVSGAKSAKDNGSESSDFQTTGLPESTGKKSDNSQQHKDSNPDEANPTVSTSTSGDPLESENGEDNGARTADDKSPGSSESTDVNTPDSSNDATDDKVTIDDRLPTTETAAIGHQTSTETNKARSNVEEATDQSSPPQSGAEAPNDSSPVAKDICEDAYNDVTDLTSECRPVAGSDFNNISILTEISDVPTDERLAEESEDDTNIIESTPGALIPTGRSMRVAQIDSIPSSIIMNDELGESCVLDEKKVDEGALFHENCTRTSLNHASGPATLVNFPFQFTDCTPGTNSREHEHTCNGKRFTVESPSDSDSSKFRPSLMKIQGDEKRISCFHQNCVSEECPCRPRSARFDFTGAILETPLEGAPNADDMPRDRAFHSSPDDSSSLNEMDLSDVDKNPLDDTSEESNASVGDIESALPDRAFQPTSQVTKHVSWAADVVDPQPTGKLTFKKEPPPRLQKSDFYSTATCCFCVILLPVIGYLIYHFVLSEDKDDAIGADSISPTPSPSAPELRGRVLFP